MATAKQITLIGLIVASGSPSIGASPPVDLGVLADNLGVMNAWKLIPEALRSQCVKEFPQEGEAFGQAYEIWQTEHRSFLTEISKALDGAAPILAPAFGVNAPEARKKIDDYTRTLIKENYLSGGPPGIKNTCDRYVTIVGNLSDPGQLATVRGLMYHVEWMIHDQKQRP